MKARIRITLKNGVLDPQGKAIQGALGALGFAGVNDVRQGKYIEVDVAEESEAKARAEIERMCKELLGQHRDRELFFRTREVAFCLHVTHLSAVRRGDSE